MDWLEVVRYGGIVVAFASALWLWGLRRRRLLTWQTGFFPACFMALGMVADLWPVFIGASFWGLYLLCEFGIYALCGTGRPPSRRLDFLDPWHREDIEIELAKKETWTKSVHRP